MSMNPYSVLGVPDGASMDEVKKAYRKKARENHPDLNPNDPQAAERMNQINEAYDRITNPAKYAREAARSGSSQGSPYGGSESYGGSTGGSYGSGGSSSGQGGYTHTGGSSQYGWTTTTFTWEDLFGDWANMGATDPRSIHPEANAADSAEVRAAIDHINSGNYTQAARIMANIPSTGRNARWYYLAALANYGAGNTSLGYEQIRKAVQMDPDNSSYKRAMNSFQQPGRTYTQQAETRGFNTGSQVCLDSCCCCMALSLCCPYSLPLVCCL
ncbi:MAG: J domain-containing protein [Coriobacteriia bacterium]|nr:J domain-containing protein [Coriobacteriia bacterium]